MKTVLLTGANGFIGRHLVSRLAGDHEVIALSRSGVDASVQSVLGDFTSAADLRQLDGFPIHAVVHLAAEMGATTEEAGLAVNVLGTQRLLRYAADRGCRRFLLASSIAATGCNDPHFVPDAMPIADRHRCLAQDPYGFSKAMVEQLADYFSRLLPEAQFTCFRMGIVLERAVLLGRPTQPAMLANLPALPFASLAYVSIDDVVDAFGVALAHPPISGASVYNLVGPDVRCQDPVADVIRASLGNLVAGLDLSQYTSVGAESPPLYSMAALRNDYSFTPRRSVAGVGA